MSAAADIVAFWSEAAPKKWFGVRGQLNTPERRSADQCAQAPTATYNTSHA
jgi:hypothetical protein